jgi:hypothetical protein
MRDPMKIFADARDQLDETGELTDDIRTAMMQAIQVRIAEEAEVLCAHFSTNTTNPGLALLACATIIGTALNDPDNTLIPAHLKSIMRDLVLVLINAPVPVATNRAVH